MLVLSLPFHASWSLAGVINLGQPFLPCSCPVGNWPWVAGHADVFDRGIIQEFSGKMSL